MKSLTRKEKRKLSKELMNNGKSYHEVKQKIETMINEAFDGYESYLNKEENGNVDE